MNSRRRPAPADTPRPRTHRVPRGSGATRSARAGLHYDARFVSLADAEEVVRWLATIRPLWEERYSVHREPPAGQQRRRLLRPVYWLGSWQFACLDYYRPPRGTQDRCVAAEPFPPVLARLVARAEEIARRSHRGPDLPSGWRLNTCLVNLYGDHLRDGRRVDAARVGEHKDFEPGPVASISLGERALFQFVASRGRALPASLVHAQWLDDRSLLIFGGEPWKSRTFHRVQRVDRRAGHRLPPEVEGFETRRVNFTFRWVPDEHVVPFGKLAPAARDDVRAYVAELARSSPWFARALAEEPHPPA